MSVTLVVLFSIALSVGAFLTNDESIEGVPIAAEQSEIHVQIPRVTALARSGEVKEIIAKDVPVNPSDFDVAIVGARKDVDTHTGLWDVTLHNRTTTDATLLLRAESSIGTTVVESSQSCDAVATGWECDVPAVGDVTITLATSIEHICDNNRVRLTVSAFIEGQEIPASSPRRILRHRELSCPSITLANPTYNTTTSSVSWSVTVQQRLLETDPGVEIAFDNGVTFGLMPAGCAADLSVVTCHVSTFANSNESFVATQTVGQQCNLVQHTVSVAANFADDNAIVPVSPESGLSIDVPAINPCIKRIESVPATVSIVAGSTIEIGLRVFDGDGAQFAQLPDNADVDWSAIRGTIISNSGITATYAAPTSTGEDHDQITVTLRYAGNQFTVTIEVTVTRPMPAQTATPTPTSTSTPIPTPSPTFTPTPTPSPTSTFTPTPTPSPTFTPTPTPSPTFTFTPTPTSSPTLTPTPTPTSTFTPTSTPSPTFTPTPSPTPTFTPSPTPTPTFAPPPTNTSTPGPAPTETSVTLSVVFDRLVGDDLTVSWMFEELGVPEPTNYEISWIGMTAGAQETIVTLKGVASEYTIPDIEAGVKYEMRVVAIYDGVRRAAGRIALRFNVPRTPTVELVETTETSIRLRWEAPPVDAGTIRRPVDGYELSWRLIGTGTDLTLVELGKDTREYLIDGLAAGNNCEVALRAHNGLGMGEAFITSIATDGIAPTPTPSPTFTPTPTVTPTLTATPSQPGIVDPMRLQFSELADGGAIVEWDAQLMEGAELVAFELSWSPATNGSPSMPVRLSPSTRRYLIPGIEAKTRYEVEIAAIYDDGARTTFNAAFILDVPRKPDVHVALVTSSTVQLTWIDPNDRANTVKRPAQNYELSWRSNSQGEQPSMISLDAGTTSFIIENLSASTTYEIALRGSNSLGHGEAWIRLVDTEADPIDLASTSTPTAIPVSAPTPTFTPTPIAASVTSTSSNPSTNTAKSRGQRDTDPDPPEEFDAIQGRHGITIYWDNPRWDGGTKILAYALDWHPDPPPFPLFLPPDERSSEMLGMKSGINYRMRVKALNRRDDSLPAAKRFYVRDTLIRVRPYDPFTGSISNGRSTVLKNNTELHGFEIHAAAKSLFWGDEMTISIQRHPPEEELVAKMMSQRLVSVSDVFTVVAMPQSRRTRFNNDATSYQFGTPLLICITPNMPDSALIHSFSIVQIVAPSNFRMFDSAPTEEDGEIKICARTRELEANRNLAFTVVSNQLASQPDLGSTMHEARPVGNAAIALVMFVVGPTFIVCGLTVLRLPNKPPARPFYSTITRGGGFNTG